MSNNRFEVHSHTDYSNIRLIDCINKLPKLIDRARENGLSGIAITDHEALSSHIKANQIAKELKDTGFKIALGNEIYLIDDRTSAQKYYHFILIAKDEIGYEQLRKLSTNAWYYGYADRRQFRVPTLKSELKRVVEQNPGHLIATTACLGGELSTLVLKLTDAERVDDTYSTKEYHQSIVNFILEMKNIFADDFYIECAPGGSKEQIIVNNRLYSIAQAFDVKMVIGTDAHYLKKEDRFVHEAYLKSKEEERETASFYEYSYLQTEDEIKENLSKSLLGDFYEEMVNNSAEIYEKIIFYDLNKPQRIPLAPTAEIPKKPINIEVAPIFSSMFMSDDIQKRQWANYMMDKMIEYKFIDKPEYIERIEIEADIIEHVSNELHLDTTLFAYFNTFKHYIDLFWKYGIVGPGRGSATGFLSNYLLDITQLDPLTWDLPYWRFLNKERIELPDIDIDLPPSKRPLILNAIRKERGEFGCVQVCTYGTEATKSAILTACRGYRSEDYPDGIDSDDGQYLSSLIPQERGFLWSLEEVVNGNAEKGRKPVKTFVNEINKYPGLLDIAMGIEGLINKRGEHSSGVVLYGDKPFETAAFMRTPSGSLVTQYDLHDAEYAGDIKYDFLVTEISDKIISCLELLRKDKLIEDDSIKNLYFKYLHPKNIDINNPEIWTHLCKGDILDVFQFNTGVGLSIARKLKPSNPNEMTSANAIMRLMSEKGQESMQDRYARIKQKGIVEFENEMRQQGFNDKQRAIMHKFCDITYGCVPMQEQMMSMLMEIAGFTLAEANAARKIVAKKKMNEIPQLQEQVMSKFDDKYFGQYFWNIAIRPSLGYAFSKNHSLPYSFVGIQTLVLATKFNPIYWNTACLIVSSGSLDTTEEEELVSIYEVEDDEDAEYEDLPDRSAKKKKKISTDYTKIARAIGAITNRGIGISLVNINLSDYGFSPDVKNNRIMFGLKALNKVGDEVVEEIIKNRPYTTFWEFLDKVKIKKPAMISLIKAGAFDTFGDRKKIMAYYLYTLCDFKKSLTLTNMPTLMKKNLIPEELSDVRAIYEFNRYLKSINPNKDKEFYVLDERAEEFYKKVFDVNLLEWNCTDWMIPVKVWDKIYDKEMEPLRQYLKDNKEEILFNLNTAIFEEDWESNAKGSLSKWEMESLCFYYHDHELINLNNKKYDIDNWEDIPTQPVIERMIHPKGKDIPIYHIYTIAGTVIAKDKPKSTVTLLTTTGVATVKFRKDYFSLFDKQLSRKQPDGTKKIIEKSWFTRGNMIIVRGMRRDDDFIVKKYNSTPGHQLYKILSVNADGTIEITNERGYDV